MALLKAAKTSRERLKALEQIRAATALRLREADPDEEGLEQLDRNVAQAAAAYRDGTDSFEQAVRALPGVREAIRQRLDAVRADEVVEVPITVSLPDGTPLMSHRGRRRGTARRSGSAASRSATATSSATACRAQPSWRSLRTRGART